MTTIREAYEKFDDLVSRQEKVRGAMRAELKAVKKDHTAVSGALRRDVSTFLPSLDAARLEALTRAAEGSAAKPRDFTRILAGLQEENAETSSEIAALEKIWGSAEDIARAVAERTQTYERQAAALKPLKVAAGDCNGVIKDLNRRMAPALEHNKNFTRKIGKENEAYFETFGLWKWMTSAEYRSGRAVMEAYRARKTDFQSDEAVLCGVQKTLKETESSIKTQGAEAGAALRARDEATDAQKRLVNLNAALHSPEDMLDTIQEALHAKLLADEGFANALQKELPEAAAPLSLGAAKVANLRKIIENLEEGEDNVGKTISQMETPLSKLRKGKRNAPRKTIKIDLDKIEKGVNAQTAYAAYQTTNASRARQSITSYQPAPTVVYRDSGFTFTDYLLLNMMLNSHVDHAYVHHTHSIPERVALDAGITDVAAIKPDFAAVFENAGSLDIGGSDIASTIKDLGIGSSDLSSIFSGADLGSGITDAGNGLNDTISSGGLDSIASDITDSIPDVDLGGITDGLGDIASGVGDVFSSIDLS